MSVTTTTTWDTLPNIVQHADLFAERKAWILTAITAGKTEAEIGTPVADKTFTRTWIDQAAADEWKTFITELATRNGLTVTVV
jgi:hypothetical protein